MVAHPWCYDLIIHILFVFKKSIAHTMVKKQQLQQATHHARVGYVPLNDNEGGGSNFTSPFGAIEKKKKQ